MRRSKSVPRLALNAIIEAQACHQSIPYETGERLLQQLSAHLRELANQVLNGPVDGADLAYTLATLIDRIENAPTDPNGRRH